MNRIAFETLIHANLDQMITDLQLGDWNIYVDFDGRPNADPLVKDTVAAQVTLMTAYKSARIVFDVEWFADKDELKVLRTLRHELLHIMMAEYDVFSDVVYQFCRTRQEKAVHERMLHQAAEVSVRRFEEMLDFGHKYVYPSYRQKEPHSGEENNQSGETSNLDAGVQAEPTPGRDACRQDAEEQPESWFDRQDGGDGQGDGAWAALELFRPEADESHVELGNSVDETIQTVESITADCGIKNCSICTAEKEVVDATPEVM